MNLRKPILESEVSVLMVLRFPFIRIPLLVPQCDHFWTRAIHLGESQHSSEGEQAGASGSSHCFHILLLRLLVHQDMLNNKGTLGNDHLPNGDMRKGWWKPILEEEKPVNPEPSWTILSSNISYVENNLASALVLTYEPPAENSLLARLET
ncbi:hypothetical protein Tco_1246669 [Tanacetum coccineum]